MRRAYWWRRLPNWGDELNFSMLRHLGADPQWAAPADAELVMIGSILEHLPKGWTGTVAGCGKLHEKSEVDLSRARVLALRGKLTAAAVTGLPTYPRVVLGDPGLLIPRYIPQPVAKYELGIVPHWSDTELAKRYPQGHLIDPRKPPDQVVGEIARCKRIISSSLHGLIVADAYGIPRQAEIFARAEFEGGDFKFRDYCSIYDTHPHFGEMWRAPHHIVERVQNELADAMQIAIGYQPPPKPIPSVIAPHRIRKTHISLLVPFRDDNEQRAKAWDWLHTYWKSHLPKAEIIVGSDDGIPFSKSVAINNAAKKARGNIFVILDADAYLDSQIVQNCANQISAAVAAGQKLWFMPYNKLYRLNQATTTELLRTNPEAPFAVPTPPPPSWLEPSNSQDYGHLYGAMIQIMPAKAFFEVGGMDPRYRGWGSEDAAFMRALDTLYTPHQVAPNEVLHMWHVRPGAQFSDYRTRRWAGQNTQSPNSRLAQRYATATGEPGFMRQLVDEHQQPSRTLWRRRW